MKPWIEKYRPDNMNDLILSDENRNIFNAMIKADNFHNMIFYGPPGTGKTSTILCMIQEYQNQNKCKNNYIHLNASHDRGVNVVRNELYKFVSNKNFFNNKTKFVILDEVDSMTKQAQQNLDYLMQYSNNVFFCLICNYLNKLIQPLINKVMVINFYNTSHTSTSYIKNILMNESKSVPDNVIDDYKFTYNHDLRCIINSLQSYDVNDDVLTEDRIKFILVKYSSVKLRKMLYAHEPLYVISRIFQYMIDHHSHKLSTDDIDKMHVIVTHHNNDKIFLLLDKFVCALSSKIN
jgi:DNA polymerase III delta prime subunit